MAILASANWYVRAGGNALNGGGYDAAISGAGTNYCDQDAAQLSLTDLATSGAGSTTLTSATGGFTSAGNGNCWRIASGTNFQAGYYFQTACTDTNTITLDRTPTSGGAGSGGTGRLGGAFADVAASLSSGGTVTPPTLTTPLVAGNTIWLRGAGLDDPTSVDYAQTGHAIYPIGSLAAGKIRLRGYNGRPLVSTDGLYLYNVAYWAMMDVCVKAVGSTNADLGMVRDLVEFFRCRFDRAGYSVMGVGAALVAVNCEFVNTGSDPGGTYCALRGGTYNGFIVGNLVQDWGGTGAGILDPGNMTTVYKNVVVDGGGPGIQSDIASDYAAGITGNTVVGCVDGIKLTTARSVGFCRVNNNVLVNNSGYGINASVGSAALNDRLKALVDYNAFYNNTSGEVNGISNGDNDITLTADPFTNAAGGDFTLNGTAGGGAALKGVAFPTSIP